MPRTYHHVWGASHEAILKLSNEAQNSFQVKSRIAEDIGQFFPDPINKDVMSFRNSLIEYVKGDGRQFEHFFLPKKVFTLTLFAKF